MDACNAKGRFRHRRRSYLSKMSMYSPAPNEQAHDRPCRPIQGRAGPASNSRPSMVGAGPAQFERTPDRPCAAGDSPGWSGFTLTEKSVADIVRDDATSRTSRHRGRKSPSQPELCRANRSETTAAVTSDEAYGRTFTDNAADPADDLFASMNEGSALPTRRRDFVNKYRSVISGVSGLLPNRGASSPALTQRASQGLSQRTGGLAAPRNDRPGEL
jgi:hypothetical protein